MRLVLILSIIYLNIHPALLQCSCPNQPICHCPPFTNGIIPYGGGSYLQHGGNGGGGLGRPGLPGVPEGLGVPGGFNGNGGNKLVFVHAVQSPSYPSLECGSNCDQDGEPMDQPPSPTCYSPPCTRVRYIIENSPPKEEETRCAPKFSLKCYLYDGERSIPNCGVKCYKPINGKDHDDKEDTLENLSALIRLLLASTFKNGQGGLGGSAPALLGGQGSLPPSLLNLIGGLDSSLSTSSGGQGGLGGSGGSDTLGGYGSVGNLLNLIGGLDGSDSSTSKILSPELILELLQNKPLDKCASEEGFLKILCERYK